MATSVNTSVTITYDWGGSLTYSQTIIPGTDKLIQYIDDLPSDCQAEFRAKLAENELVSDVSFNKITHYKEESTNTFYYPNNSTSDISSDLVLYPRFNFVLYYNVRCLRDTSETAHTSWGSSFSTVCYLSNSDKNFLIQNNSFDGYISVRHSFGLSSFTYNNKIYNTYGWAENDSWNSIYITGTSIPVNVKNGYPIPIKKQYADVYTDNTPINLILNSGSANESKTIKLRGQTLLMVLESSLSIQGSAQGILPENQFSKKGRKFCGWSLNKDDSPGSSTLLAPGTSISLSESTTYYAIWELKPQSSLKMWYGINGKWTPMS